MKAIAEIRNTSDYAKEHKYIVARCCGGEVWFYGAWDDKDEAERIAREIDGAVFINE